MEHFLQRNDVRHQGHHRGGCTLGDWYSGHLIPAANGNYETGEVIEVTVTFSGAVTVDTASGTPSLALNIGSNTRQAIYSASDSTATALVFAYPVTANDRTTTASPSTPMRWR